MPERETKQQKLDRITQNHRNAEARARGEDPKTASPVTSTTPTPEDAKPAVADDDALGNLSDRSVQDRIMDPEGMELELSYETIRLYPPTMALRRQIFGFCTRVLKTVFLELPPGVAPTAEGVDRVGTFINMGVTEKINESPQTSADTVGYIVRMMDKPGKMTNEEAIPLATEILEKATWRDLVKLFAHLSTVSGANALSANAKN